MFWFAEAAEGAHAAAEHAEEAEHHAPIIVQLVNHYFGEAALRPFVRVGDAAQRAGGSGLGLSLAAAVARLHRAQLTLGDNSPGLIVHCEFPKLPLPDATAGTASHRSH